MKSPTRLRLIGYVRVSDQSQKDNTSPQDQARIITDFCDREGHELFAVFSDVGSGANVDGRHAFKEALNLIFLDDAADGLVVYNFDRFTRSCEDGPGLRRKFQDFEKALISATEPLDVNTIYGKAYYNLKTVFSEMERDMIKDRTSRGRAAQRARGSWTGHGVPYGYRVEKTRVEGKDFKQLVPDADEQAVVEKILKWRYEDHMSGLEIAARLNADGVPPKRGKAWYSSNVLNVCSWRRSESLTVTPETCVRSYRIKVPAEETAAMVLKLRAEGKSFRSIAWELNRRGIPYSTCRKGSAETWTPDKARIVYLYLLDTGVEHEHEEERLPPAG